MKKVEFSDKMDKIYRAIRNTYGYTDDADELVDFVIDATDSAYRECEE